MEIFRKTSGAISVQFKIEIGFQKVERPAQKQGKKWVLECSELQHNSVDWIDFDELLWLSISKKYDKNIFVSHQIGPYFFYISVYIQYIMCCVINNKKSGELAWVAFINYLECSVVHWKFC